MEIAISSVTQLFDISILLYMVAGLAFGVICGAIPGLNAGIGIALMLPVTYGLDPLSSLVFLTSIYTGATKRLACRSGPPRWVGCWAWCFW